MKGYFYPLTPAPRGRGGRARPPGRPGRGEGEAVEVSRPARRCGGVANGGGAHPRDAQYCKRLLLGAYTSSLIRTADSRARRTWCFRPGSRARGGAVVGARELEGTTMCLYWAGAYWVSAVRTAQTPVHLAWRCLAGWLLEAQTSLVLVQVSYREESLARFALKGQTARLVHAPLKESHQSVGISWVGVPHAVEGRLQNPSSRTYRRDQGPNHIVYTRAAGG